MGDRFLVMGDNHGDVESLRRVHDAVADERLDYVVHVGDFTRAWRHDRALGVDQLASVEPVLAAFDAVAEHGLVWVWGNQDYFGDLDYDLSVGHEIPADDVMTVGGRRFTNDPERVTGDEILVTHMEHWSLVDHFEGAAHFCGNTHLGRWRDRRLNAAFLHVTERGSDEETFGGYFIVEFGESMSVEMHSIGSLHRNECPVHDERGTQYLPAGASCPYCRDQAVLMREMAGSAHYGLSHDADTDAVPESALVDYACRLWDDPPPNFRSAFTSYLETIESDKYAPLARTDQGFVVAEDSYSY